MTIVIFVLCVVDVLSGLLADMQMLEKHAKQIDRLLDKFAVRDKAFKNPEYKYKDRFVQISLALRQDKEEETAEQKRREAAEKEAKDTSTTFTSLLSRSESTIDVLPSLTSEKDPFENSSKKKQKPNALSKYKGKNRSELLRVSYITMNTYFLDMAAVSAVPFIDL
jgi:hypothetical protein